MFACLPRRERCMFPSGDIEFRWQNTLEARYKEFLYLISVRPLRPWRVFVSILTQKFDAFHITRPGPNLYVNRILLSLENEKPMLQAVHCLCWGTRCCYLHASFINTENVLHTLFVVTACMLGTALVRGYSGNPGACCWKRKNTEVRPQVLQRGLRQSRVYL